MCDVIFEQPLTSLVFLTVEGTVTRISNLCPELKRLRVLTEDRSLEIFAREGSGLKIEELDAHIAWSLAFGFDLFAITFSHTLNSIKLTILDNYSWAVIKGKNIKP